MWDVTCSWLHLRMKEEMRPVIRLRQNFLMILRFLLDQMDLLDLLDRQDRLAHHQDGLQLHQPAGDRERMGPRNASCERLPLRPSSPEPRLIPISMNDGDGQPPQEERQRWRSRSRERVYPHAQVPQEPQIQPLITPEPDDVSGKNFSEMNPSSPAIGPPPSAEQRGRSRRNERYRSLERTPPHSSSQDADEDSATVDPQNRVSDRSRSPQEQEASRGQDPQQHKRNEDCCRTTAEWFAKCQKAQVYWFRWRRRRTSKWAWNLFKHSNYCTRTSLKNLVMKTVSTAMNLVHKVKTPKGPCTIQISTFWQMMSIGQWHLRHTSMQQLDHFALWLPKMEIKKTYTIWSRCRVYNDHCASMERPTTSTT